MALARARSGPRRPSSFVWFFWVAFQLTSAAWRASAAADAIGGGWLHGGAMGEYFNSTDLSGTPAFSRRDVRIDFDWGARGRPGGSRANGYSDLTNGNYSVRWTGQLMARFSETYQFTLEANDGARLRIAPAGSSLPGDWTTVVDAWGSPGTHVGGHALVAGQAYDVRLEYRRLDGPGVCRLRWSSPSTPLEVLDAATILGINVATYADRMWANVMDGGRDSWTVDSQGGGVLRDASGWPMEDAYNIPFEGQDPVTASGTYLLQFTGRAEVQANVFAPIRWTAGGSTYTDTLPFGAGYDAASNRTTATLTIDRAMDGILYLRFRQTRREASDLVHTGVKDVKLMRPLTPGGASHEPLGNTFSGSFKKAMERYAVLRWILNFDTEAEWSDRVLPSYATHVDVATRRYWEQMVQLSNETGKDLYACLPVRASNEYLTQVANLIRYGSDGVSPYTSVQEDPVFPPLNPNLHVILEHENEVWNYGFANFGNNLADLRAAVAADAPDWRVVNYDGAYTADPDGAWLRWHVLRGLRASEIFRGVFGDAAMGSRVRVLYEYQYDDANGTASSALTFVDNYFNNADGTNHVAQPHPVNHYFWGAGGATYYGSGNPDGIQSDFGPDNASLELPALGAGEARVAPAGAGWTFSGTAGIYSAAALDALWTHASLGVTASASPNTALGCRFSVGPDPVAVYELGRWIVSGNSRWHTIHLMDVNRVELATASVDAAASTPGGYAYVALNHPVILQANTSYYLVSEEAAGGDAFLAGTMVTAAGGITVDGAATATFGAGWDPSTYAFSPIEAGSQVLGPVNLRYATAPVGAVGYPPMPPSGRQAAFLQGTGSMSQTVHFPKAGTYSLTFSAASDPQFPNTFRFLLDGATITPRGGSGIAPTTNQWYAGAGWGLDARTFTTYSSYPFQVTAPGTHTVTLQGLGWSFYSTDLDTRRITYFDSLGFSSADALFDGGIPGTGQAFGQVGSSDYRAQVFSQARYAQAYGLQVVAYEGGWSIGGDFHSTAFQNWCKYFDPRAAAAQRSSLDIFAQSGSRFYVTGTYETWPNFDTANSGDYPLTQAADSFNGTLPPEPLNGRLVPNVLTPADNTWLINAFAGTSTLQGTGGWFCWNVLAPNSGTFGISAKVSKPSSVVLEVDGNALSQNPATGVVTHPLTRGLHSVKLRSTGGSVVVTNLTLVELGAPGAPSWNGDNPVGSGHVDVSWTPLADGPAAAGYVVRFGTNSGTYPSSVDAGGATRRRISGLVDGQSYYLVVVATNASGYSLPSAELRITPVAPGQSQTLLSWDFFAAGGNAATDGNVARVDSTYRAYGVQPSTLLRGSGTPANEMYWGFAGRGAMNLNPERHWVSDSLAAAKAAGDYFELSIAPAPGKRLSLGSLAYVFYQQNENPGSTVALEYSTDGFATPGTLIDTHSGIRWYWNGATNTVSLAGIAGLQDVASAVTFRLWGYGFPAWQDKGLGGVPGKNPDVELVGSVRSAIGFSVESLAATGITRVGATLGGDVVDEGGAPVTERGVVYAPTSVNDAPILGGVGVIRASVLGATGTFTVGVAGLSPGIGYSYRAYAVNGDGTSYSPVATFSTLSNLEDWRRNYFGNAANSGNGANNANPQGDGLSNLEKYAFGLDPTATVGSGDRVATIGGVILARGRPDVVVHATSSTSLGVKARFVRRKTHVEDGLTYAVRFSSDLSAWQTSTATPTVVASDADFEVVEVPYPLFLGGQKAGFFTVVVRLGN